MALWDVTDPAVAPSWRHTEYPDGTAARCDEAEHQLEHRRLACSVRPMIATADPLGTTKLESEKSRRPPRTTEDAVKFEHDASDSDGST
jgi:hypothetical protein